MIGRSAILLFLLLGACSERETVAGELTAEESRQLDEAAAMLDETPNIIAAEVERTGEK